MTIKNPNTLSDGQTDDCLEYKRAFYRNSMMLIILGYQKFARQKVHYENWDEQDITGKLVEYTIAYLEGKSSEEWAWAYAVYEESPENTKGKKGKDRKRIDIVCELTQRGRHPRLKFEAKRLKKYSNPVGIYLGKEGLQEFIEGNYAPNDNVVGMLGYVQSDDYKYWVGQIADKLKADNIKLEDADFAEIGNCYQSLHKRTQSGREIRVLHLLLNYVWQDRFTLMDI